MMLRVFIILSFLCLAVFSLPLHKLKRRNAVQERKRDTEGLIPFLASRAIANYGGTDSLLNREELRQALNQILQPDTTSDYLVPIFFNSFDGNLDRLISEDELVAAFAVYDPLT